VYAAASRSDFVAAAYGSFGPKLTQTMRQTHLITTFDISCNRPGHNVDRNCKKYTLVIDIRICTTIMASANRAANNSKH